MNVAKWLLLMLLALPFLELTAFFAVAATIGFGWALVLVLAGSFTGAWILRHATGSHIARIRAAMGEGGLLAIQADRDGGLVLFAGILLLIPGFITDALAIILLSAALWRAAARRRRQTTLWSISHLNSGTRCRTPPCPIGAMTTGNEDRKRLHRPGIGRGPTERRRPCSLLDPMLANRRATGCVVRRSVS